MKNNGSIHSEFPHLSVASNRYHALASRQNRLKKQFERLNAMTEGAWEALEKVKATYPEEVAARAAVVAEIEASRTPQLKAA